MDAMRNSWTDDRLDDFAAHTYRRFDGVDQRFDGVDRRFDSVDRRFDAVDQRFDSVERRMSDGFGRVDAELRGLRTEMNSRFERVEGRIDDINRTMLRLGSGAIATFIVGFAGLIATQL